MSRRPPDCELTFVLRCGDDEELIGHAITRLTTHLRGLRVAFELLVVDEGSGDNTLAIAALLRKQYPELETLHAEPGRGYVVAAEQARGLVVVLTDVRKEPPLALLGYALARSHKGADVVAVGARLLLYRRTRALRAIEALSTLDRDTPSRFVRRARAIGLTVAEVHPRRQRVLDILRQVLPIGSWAGRWASALSVRL